jgi:hypothetical protein
MPKRSSTERVRKMRQEQRALEYYLRELGFEWLGDVPEPADPDRRERCSKSLEQFAMEYLPDQFDRGMSDGQRADLDTMQRVCSEGGRYAFAAPRGDGKTTRVEAAVLWAALYGKRRCVIVVGADLGAANEILESVKQELRINDRLREDFPIPCWAALASDDTPLKAKQWTWGGQPLGFEWSKGRLRLPLLPGVCNGCVIVPRGLTGRLRGMRIKIGKQAVRPDLYIIDDPQTDESANSAAQCDVREKLILGAIMGGGGPGRDVAAMMPCTIIRAGDLAARFLDHEAHPDWQGRTRAMVMAWPDAQDSLWKHYHKLRREESADAAHTYYIEHQIEMDAGAVLDWPERYNHDTEVSALEHAENLLCDRGEEVFAAEYQNAPIEGAGSIYRLTHETILNCVHVGRQRGEIPAQSKVVVVATDINHYGLHSVAAAYGNDQTAWVPWYYRHDNDGRGIVDPNTPEIEAKRKVFAALVDAGNGISALRFRQDGAEVACGLWLIDGGYMPDIVRRYIEGPGRSVGVTVAMVRGFSADRYRPHGKNVVGKPREWCHMTDTAIAGRHIAFCSDYWREVAQKAWLSAPNAPGSCSLYDGGRHREYAEHICRERLILKTIVNGITIWRWNTQPGWHDYGDCMTMAYVGAAWCGIGTVEAQPRATRYVERRKPKVRRQAV